MVCRCAEGLNAHEKRMLDMITGTLTQFRFAKQLDKYNTEYGSELLAL